MNHLDLNTSEGDASQDSKGRKRKIPTMLLFNLPEEFPIHHKNLT